MIRQPWFFLLSAVLMITGCTTTYNPAAVRQEQATAQSAALAARTEQELPNGQLTLDDAIRLAWKHNLDLELAGMRQRLQKLAVGGGPPH